MISCLPIPTLLLNSDKKIVDCNSQWVRSFGSCRVDGDSDYAEIYPDLKTLGNDLDQSLRKKSKEQKVFKIERGGDCHVFEFHINPWIQTDSQLVGLILVAIDVTPLINHQERIKELERSNEELDQFAYIASHDLREPLRGMKNFSQFLIEDYEEKLEKEGLSYLQKISKLASRLESYLDSLLFYSRLGRERMAIEEIDTGTLMEDVKDTIESSTLKKVDIKIAPSMPTIQCDRTKLLTIFTNLIRNSIKYNDNDVIAIEIASSQESESHHKFSITDNGIGIKMEHWETIFTPFKRLHPKEDYDGGTGLGLNLVKKAVERHAGSIWIEGSVPQEGTTISFTLTKDPSEKFSALSSSK